MIFVKAAAVVFLFIQSFPAQSATPKNNTRGTLIVKITGFENDVGDCWFALDNSKKVFEEDTSVYIGKILPIKNQMVTIELQSISFGEYAIKAFHDENKNGELDTDFLGIPDEKYGYSNDASDWFGPPSWDEAKFLFNKNEMIIEIHLD